MNSIYNVATVSPSEVYIGNPEQNVKYMKYLSDKIEAHSSNSADIVVFPELCITGYTCGDLFNQSKLIEDAMDALLSFVDYTKHYDALYFVGCPIRKNNQLFNCAVAIHNGKVLGVIPKTYIPNYNEFYESRYFSSSENLCDDNLYISRLGKTFPFSPNILICNDMDGENGIVVAAEICEDAWVPLSPSRYHCVQGANVIVNLSASNETIGKSAYRREMLKMHSATCACNYIYTSASKAESTSDTVFSGHQMIVENGHIISEATALSDQEITYGQIDIEKCMNDRYRSNTFASTPIKHTINEKAYLRIYCRGLHKIYSNKPDNTLRPVSVEPFVPTNLTERMEEIITIQATGLAQRLKKIGCSKVVIGISGGLDSTLALIVAVEAFKINGYANGGIIGVTMPAYGTSTRTFNNSLKLMEAFHVTQHTIDITAACDRHLKDIEHDKSSLDITFENAQARERTQVLMDMANKYGAIVIGTGDMSELALGWCTYNGDHMSMYGVNSSIPKTLVRHLVREYAKKMEKKGALYGDYKMMAHVLNDICDTPISPELLPPKADGTIAQNTEDTIGSYVTHDFIMYYMLRYGFSPKKILSLYITSLEATGEKINEATFSKIKKDMATFYKRFQNNQFKRNCLPDGVKVGSVALSPRADWRMPSEADMSQWLDEIEKVKF